MGRSWFRLLLTLALGGCGDTPERACRRFVRAVAADDVGGVFDGLLQTTQWSLHTVAKDQRKMRGLIEDRYPPAERAAALGRLSGPAGDGRDLFQVAYQARYRADLRGRLGAARDLPLPALMAQATLKQDGGSAVCQAPGGGQYRFAQAKSGRWGLSELDAEWEQTAVRAVHDLDTVRDNARLYQRTRP